MKDDEFLLTFEKGEHKEVLYVYTDLDGLDNLIDELTKLRESAQKGKNDHTHLMTEEWGGHELSSKSQSGEIFNHVKIYCHNEDKNR